MIGLVSFLALHLKICTFWPNDCHADFHQTAWNGFAKGSSVTLTLVYWPGQASTFRRCLMSVAFGGMEILNTYPFDNDGQQVTISFQLRHVSRTVFNVYKFKCWKINSQSSVGSAGRRTSSFGSCTRFVPLPLIPISNPSTRSNPRSSLVSRSSTRVTVLFRMASTAGLNWGRHSGQNHSRPTSSDHAEYWDGVRWEQRTWKDKPHWPLHWTVHSASASMLALQLLHWVILEVVEREP
uniref:(northern house mosquito) hypothetical protein n=1 Tax=Culex pipiens TaxID=7175 RepID=A0A8D8LB52_CULPI